MADWFNRNRAIATTAIWLGLAAIIFHTSAESVAVVIMSIWAWWLAEEVDKLRTPPASQGE